MRQKKERQETMEEVIEMVIVCAWLFSPVAIAVYLEKKDKGGSDVEIVQ